MNLFRRGKPQVEGSPDTSKFRCTYCGGDRFFAGPEAPGAQNFLCANPDCRHWFNDMGNFGVQDLNRVEPTANERQLQRQKDVEDRREKMVIAYNQGAEFYARGLAPSMCMEANLQGLWNLVRQEDLWCVLGYIAAHRSAIKTALEPAPEPMDYSSR